MSQDDSLLNKFELWGERSLDRHAIVRSKYGRDRVMYVRVVDIAFLA